MGGVDGVFEASENFCVRWVAQCGGQSLDGCGVVVLLARSVYGVSSGIHWGGCVAGGIRGRCCRWLWCGVSSRTRSSPGVWLVFWCLACVSARPLPYA